MGEGQFIMQGWLSQLRDERRTIAALSVLAGLGPERRCDIHLCYGDAPDVTFKGFLVTWRGNLDRLVAFCPISIRLMRERIYRGGELRRAFTAAVEAAMRPESARRATESIWLGAAGDMDRPIPGWIYGLKCVPLVGEWDGEFHSPRPFCPELFERMAGQPQAMRWLRNRQASMEWSVTGGNKPGGGEGSMAPTTAARVPPPGAAWIDVVGQVVPPASHPGPWGSLEKE